MSNRKVYAIVTLRGCTYAAHIDEGELSWRFDTFKLVSKAEYRAARAAGTKSWGEYETQCRRDDIEPMRRTGWAW